MYKLKSRGTAKATVKKITEDQTYTIRDVSKETTNNALSIPGENNCQATNLCPVEISFTNESTNKQKPNFLPGDAL